MLRGVLRVRIGCNPASFPYLRARARVVSRMNGTDIRMFMAGLNACGPKICEDNSGLIVCWLHNYTALHSSYHIGEPSLIPKLLLPCVLWERGSIDNPLTFDVGLKQLSFYTGLFT